MRRLALAITSLAFGCVEQPTQPASFIDAAVVQAHSPAHLGVSPTFSPASTPAYVQLDAASAAGTAGSLHLSVDAGGTISRFPDDFIRSVAVFGYAWVDSETGHGIVAVIHPAIGRDSHQNPDAWHTHPVLLSAGTAASTFCLAGIGTSQGGATIRDDVIDLNIALRQTSTPASALDVAASFVVAGDAGWSRAGPRHPTGRAGPRRPGPVARAILNPMLAAAYLGHLDPSRAGFVTVGLVFLLAASGRPRSLMRPLAAGGRG